MRATSARLVWTGAAALGAFAAARAAEGDGAPVDFGREIRPLLSDRCFRCHGPDAAARRGKLRLDSFAAATADRGGYSAIAPGAPEASELIARVTSDDPRERMPPPDSKLSLSDEERELFRRWIEQGAEYEEPWFVVPPARSAPPAVADAGWPRDALDRFVLAELEAAGRAPAAEASRAAWLRRVSFDLTGLPPTLDELDAFLADERGEDAYAAVLDRLLASPRYGERMASDWLDVARYADTYGYQNDVGRRVWPWRDWVIEAFNENLAWDEFVTWQLAGDLLPDATRDQRLATAFNRLHRQTNEGGSVEEEFRVEYVSDRVHTFGTAFLGLTLECARCHDHKYDPLEQRDYYRLSAFFDDIDESGLYSHFTRATPTPTLPLPTPEQEQQVAEARARVAAAEATLAEAERAHEGQIAAYRGGDGPFPGLVGHFSFEAIEEDGLRNLANQSRPGRVADGPRLVAGVEGNALALDGEDNATFPGVGEFTRVDPFTIALWLRTPEPFERAVVLHRSRSWTDAGSQGYQLLIEDGRLSASLIHFWPGDAIRVRTVDLLPIDAWVHAAVRYDGSSRAAGLELFLDGRAIETEVVRDHLVKSITGGGDLVLTVGQRFRDRGFRGGAVDELMVFDRRLAATEIRSLVTGETVYGMEARVARSDPGAVAAREALRVERAALAKLLDAVPEIMTMSELPEPRTAYLLRRGSYLERVEPVAPGTPAFLGPMPADLPRDRLGLARWLTSDTHPLFARVAVNRLWQLLFGRGLVATTENFGSQGTPPSHPALLDALALDFRDSGYDVKALLKRLALSATYRQSSARRLSAEMIRDQSLFVSGLLVEQRGGPPVRPYQPAGLWKEKSGQTYVADQGAGLWRRSLYTYWKRTSPPPSMMLFDAAKRDVCVARRRPTSTPLQMLALWNDPQQVEAARALAARALEEEGANAERLARAFRHVTSRAPSADEVEVLAQLLADARAEYTAAPASAAELLAVGTWRAPDGLEPTELAAWSVVAGTILACDAAVVLR